MKIVLILYGVFFILGSLLAPAFAAFGEGQFADKLYFIFINCCHQQPDRTYWIMGYPMALCARCIGIYFGFVAYLLISLFSFKIRHFRYSLYLLIIGLSEILIEYNGFFDGSNFIRTISGIMLGIFIAYIVDNLISLIGGKKCLISKNA